MAQALDELLMARPTEVLPRLLTESLLVYHLALQTFGHLESSGSRAGNGTGYPSIYLAQIPILVSERRNSYSKGLLLVSAVIRRKEVRRHEDQQHHRRIPGDFDHQDELGEVGGPAS